MEGSRMPPTQLRPHAKDAHPEVPTLFQLLCELLLPRCIPPELVLKILPHLEPLCPHCLVPHGREQIPCSACGLVMSACGSRWAPNCPKCSHRQCHVCERGAVCDGCYPDEAMLRIKVCYTCGQPACVACYDMWEGDVVCRACGVLFYGIA
ncbi:hypothetical protein DFJ74DRAFT_438734 [Hyaloraphidium curvatum]|nr:hypothetical protein DFJ74DRAFT_438734 [Hyaloraphidium curvatum]